MEFTIDFIRSEEEEETTTTTTIFIQTSFCLHTHACVSHRSFVRVITLSQDR